MKYAIASLLLLVCSAAMLHAQSKIFMRVYGASGKKISKGYFYGTTDAALLLRKAKKSITISVQQIDVIKTERSKANRILSVPVIVIIAAVLAVIAIAYVATLVMRPRIPPPANQHPATLSKQVKPLKEYRIDCNPATWQVQRGLLNQLL
jgi:hypothetical protein